MWNGRPRPLPLTLSFDVILSEAVVHKVDDNAVEGIPITKSNKPAQLNL
jgi:hypothetical protein